MTIDVTEYGHFSDEELVRTTYHDLNATSREMSLAIRLGDAMDTIRALQMGVKDDFDD